MDYRTTSAVDRSRAGQGGRRGRSDRRRHGDHRTGRRRDAALKFGEGSQGSPESEWERSLEPYLPLFQGPPAIPQAFADARRRLRIRLAADASDPGWAAYRPVCDGLDQMLVLTTDCGAMTISDEQIEKWGVPADDVWAEALDHTIWDEPAIEKSWTKKTCVSFGSGTRSMRRARCYLLTTSSRQPTVSER